MYGGVAAVVLLVVATVALVVAPPTPPSVAEFAPQATDTIEEAPPNQSSQFGAGEGGCAEGQVCGTTTTTEPPEQAGTPAKRRDRVFDVKRVRRCVGDPPRQTEDPHSPPCVNYWEGDNGGATARGVTANEIRVAVPEDVFPLFDAFLGHFNSRYELYGRKIRLVATTSGLAEAAEEVGAFAAVSWNFDGRSSTDFGFARDAARRGIVAVTGVAGFTETEDDYRSAAPFAWSYRPPSDTLQRALGSFACSSLARRQAEYAGPQFRTSVRKFGIVVWQRPDAPSVPTAALKSALAACDVSAKVYPIDGTRSDTVPMNLMLSDRVTTALVLVDSFHISNEMMAASKVGYQPEWVLVGLDADDEFQWAAASPPEQRGGLFGIAPFNKLLPGHDEPYMWALREGGTDPSTLVGRMHTMDAAYRSLLVLASGVQAAGPHLTAQAMARGLQALRFPNPGHGAPPYYQAGVGFDVGDFAMVDDVAVTWWSETAPSYRNGTTTTGAWCYVERGKRFPPTAVPNVEDHLFSPDPGACR